MLIPARPNSLAYKIHYGLNAVRQRWSRRAVDDVYRRALATVDQRAFADAFRQYQSPGAPTRGAKYLSLAPWLRQAADRYILTGLGRMPGGRHVLDLGSGPGYFPLICRTEGHHPLALDVDDDPLYREMIRWFDLPRVVHRIEAKQPLPDLGRQFDLITAFRTCFDVRADGSPWDADDWAFLLDDLLRHLTDRGRVVLCFNVNPTTGALYSPSVAALFTNLTSYRSHLFFEFAFLSRLDRPHMAQL